MTYNVFSGTLNPTQSIRYPDPSSHLATMHMAENCGDCCAPLGGPGSLSNTLWPWAEAYLRTKWHLDPSSRLAAIDMSRKVGGCYVLCLGELSLTQCRLGQGLPPYQVAS